MSPKKAPKMNKQHSSKKKAHRCKQIMPSVPTNNTAHANKQGDPPSSWEWGMGKQYETHVNSPCYASLFMKMRQPSRTPACFRGNMAMKGSQQVDPSEKSNV